MTTKYIRIGVVGIGLVLALILGTAWLVEHPLRELLVKKINLHLKGYRVELRRLDLHPFGLSADLEGIGLVNVKQPEPVILKVPTLTAGIRCKALLRGRLVIDVQIDDPRLTIDRKNIRGEVEDEIPLEKKGWQEALSRTVPFEINRLDISDGKVSYTGKGDVQPLVVDKIDFRAGNIRNIQNPDTPYPSEIDLSGRVFGDGSVAFKGRADFLAPGLPALKGRLELKRIVLDLLGPLAEGSRIAIDSGTIESLRVDLESNPSVRRIHLLEATIDDLKSSYVTPGGNNVLAAEIEKSAGTKKKSGPKMVVRVDTLTLAGANIGFINHKTDPDYRVFASDVQLEVNHLNDDPKKEPATVRLRGAFMGSGNMAVYGTFRPRKNDFDLRLAIQGTPVTDMNALLKAYTGLDAASGLFSLYSNVSVHDGRIDGYVKPLLRSIEMLDSRQDRDENLFNKIYEGAVDVLTELLENQPRDEVATRTDLSGKLENPDADTLETLLNLVRNAFFDAILPGFGPQQDPD